MMTTQDIFDKVAIHLLTQMEKSRDVIGRCVYKGPGKLRCAVGCLITGDVPGVYNGVPVSSPIVRGLLERDIGRSLEEAEKDMLQDLQNIHDKGSVAGWERLLRDCAARYGLDFKGVQA